MKRTEYKFFRDVKGTEAEKPKKVEKKPIPFDKEKYKKRMAGMSDADKAERQRKIAAERARNRRN